MVSDDGRAFHLAVNNVCTCLSSHQTAPSTLISICDTVVAHPKALTTVLIIYPNAKEIRIPLWHDIAHGERKIVVRKTYSTTTTKNNV